MQVSLYGAPVTTIVRCMSSPSERSICFRSIWCHTALAITSALAVGWGSISESVSAISPPMEKVKFVLSRPHSHDGIIMSVVIIRCLLHSMWDWMMEHWRVAPSIQASPSTTWKDLDGEACILGATLHIILFLFYIQRLSEIKTSNQHPYKCRPPSSCWLPRDRVISWAWRERLPRDRVISWAWRQRLPRDRVISWAWRERLPRD